LVGSRCPALAAGVLLLLAAPIQAGPIFVPGQLDGDKFTPAAGVPSSWYTVRYSTAGVTVEDAAAARVQVEDVIEGPEKAVEAVCLIPPPDGADGADVRVTIGAPGARPTVLAAEYLDPSKAQKVYETVARGAAVAKLLAYSGRPALLVPRVELQGKAHMNLSFRTPVHRPQGVNWLSCRMPAPAWTRSTVERLALTVDLKTKEPLRTVFSPTHHASVQRKGLNEATATVKADHWSGLDDFRLFWVADRDDLGLRVLAF